MSSDEKTQELLSATNVEKSFHKMYLKHDEAAEFLGVQPSTLYKWCHKRKIRYIKSGKLNLFKMTDLIAFLERNAVSDALQIQSEAHDLLHNAKRNAA